MNLLRPERVQSENWSMSFCCLLFFFFWLKSWCLQLEKIRKHIFQLVFKQSTGPQLQSLREERFPEFSMVVEVMSGRRWGDYCDSCKYTCWSLANQSYGWADACVNMMSWIFIFGLLYIPNSMCTFTDIECYVTIMEDFYQKGDMMMGAVFSLYIFYTVNKVPHIILSHYFQDIFL